MSHVTHLSFLFVALATMAAVCRWIWSTDRVLGWMAATGILLRLAFGFGLLGISWFNLPILRSLHTGDGFWAIAPDARVYYALAARAASGGLGTINAGDPSPVFLSTLALWFRGAGIGLGSAIWFNVVCYALTAALIVMAIRRRSDGEWTRRAGVFALAALTFSPMLLYTGSQVLKDPFFSLATVLACVAAVISIDLLAHGANRLADSVLAAGAIAVGIYAVAGVRAYYALFLWAAYVTASCAAVYRARRAALLRRSAIAAATACLLWVAFMAGAGAYYGFYRDLIQKLTGVPLPHAIVSVTGGASGPMTPGEPDLAAFATTVVSMRRGFVQSGGATNLADGSGQWVVDSAVDTLVGIAAMFVPVSALQATGVVTFHGGRGFLFVTDLDTLFIDFSFAAAFFVCWRMGRLQFANAPGILFIAVVSAVSGLLLAYIVTNFGTLVRLRLLSTVPVWLAPAAIALRPRERAVGPEPPSIPVRSSSA